MSLDAALLDELGRVFAHAAVDAFLSAENEKAPAGTNRRGLNHEHLEIPHHDPNESHGNDNLPPDPGAT
jgi:hypothetical protein